MASNIPKSSKPAKTRTMPIKSVKPIYIVKISVSGNEIFFCSSILILKFLNFFLLFQYLLGFGGNNLILKIRRDDLDGRVFQAGEKQTLAHIGLQKQLFLGFGKIESFSHDINFRRRLL